LRSVFPESHPTNFVGFARPSLAFLKGSFTKILADALPSHEVARDGGPGDGHIAN